MHIQTNLYKNTLRDTNTHAQIHKSIHYIHIHAQEHSLYTHTGIHNDIHIGIHGGVHTNTQTLLKWGLKARRKFSAAAILQSANRNKIWESVARFRYNDTIVLEKFLYRQNNTAITLDWESDWSVYIVRCFINHRKATTIQQQLKLQCKLQLCNINFNVSCNTAM